MFTDGGTVRIWNFEVPCRAVSKHPRNKRHSARWLAVVFMKGGKSENPEKNPRSKDKNQQETQPIYGVDTRTGTRATLDRTHQGTMKYR